MHRKKNFSPGHWIGCLLYFRRAGELSGMPDRVANILKCLTQTKKKVEGCDKLYPEVPYDDSVVIARSQQIKRMARSGKGLEMKRISDLDFLGKYRYQCEEERKSQNYNYSYIRLRTYLW